jgi:hypothetical protein
MQLIKISDMEQLLDIQEISEKLSQISLSLKLRLQEKNIFNDNEELDIMDNVLEFFIDWVEEFSEDISFKNIEDSIYISKSEQKMIKKMILFYETEVNGVDKNFLENESESFKDVMFSLGIEMKEFYK